MVTVTLSSGHIVPANIHDMKDIMSSVDNRLRYQLTTRQKGELMITNRIKRAAALLRARQRAKLRRMNS